MSRTEQLKQRVMGGSAPVGAEPQQNEGRELTVNQAVDKLAKFLAGPAVMQQIAKALPRHLTADRLVRIATTELRKNPKLALCSPMSFLGAVIQCAQLGLEPGSALGHVYIIPFDRREKVNGKWQTVEVVATVILGYRGMVDLARRSGQIESIEAWPVYMGDKFECTLGLDPNLIHAPDWENALRTVPENLRFVYAVARLKGGGRQFTVMSRAEVEMIRDRAFAKNRVDVEKYSGPWKSDFEQMALKTVVRRLFKMLPVSIEMQVMDALRTPATDELALGDAAAAMLGDGPEQPPEDPDAPQDVRFTDLPREPQPDGSQEVDPESLQTDFDQAPVGVALTLGQKIEARMREAAAKQDGEMLDVQAEEIRELASEAERAQLGTLYRQLREGISAQ